MNGVDVFVPNAGEIRSDGPEGIACWFIDTDYNGESFFVRHAYFPGAASDPYKALKTTLKAEIDAKSMGDSQKRHVAPLRQARLGPHSRKGNQPSGRRSDEDVPRMMFRISDTFTRSLSRLTNEEQRAASLTAFNLQLDTSHPGLHFERLHHPNDPNFRSVRVNRELRIIAHVLGDSLTLCYVDHHDDAYRWATRRKLEVHPNTGAMQMVELRETVREVPVYVEVERPAPTLFRSVSDGELLGYGIPQEWLEDVRRVASEDALMDLVDHLPQEAAEALVNLATGSMPVPPHATPLVADPFEHPDAQRRFRVISDREELERALDFPWERWAVFLHPTQRALVDRDYNGPARVSGSAGTGKTVVALHRAVHLARSNPDSRVLLITFSDTLANSLRAKLRVLIGS